MFKTRMPLSEKMRTKPAFDRLVSGIENAIWEAMNEPTGIDKETADMLKSDYEIIRNKYTTRKESEHVALEKRAISDPHIFRHYDKMKAVTTLINITSMVEDALKSMLDRM